MEEKINGLKEKLQYIDTRKLLRMIGTKFIAFRNNMQDIVEQSAFSGYMYKNNIEIVNDAEEKQLSEMV